MGDTPPEAVARAASPPGPVRVTVLTGFLGAGKTTLLNRILADPSVTDTAVIVNEFGEIGIDHLLVEAASGEGVIELSAGCVCCTVRGELVETLLGLLDRVRDGRLGALKRIAVETTGLADPTPILASLMVHPVLAEALALDGVIAVVDAVHGGAALAAHAEAERQVACADRIVLAKTDLAGGFPPDLLAAIRRLNPRAPILDAARGEAGPAALLGCGLYDPATRTADVRRWLDGEAGACEPHRHDPHGSAGHGHPADAPSRHGRIRSFALDHRAPIPTAAIADFLDLLRATQGERLLRMKAVIWTADDRQRPLVLHGVRRHLHPPVRLPAWPRGAAPASRLVLIGEDLDEGRVRDLFAAFTGEPREGAPDRASILDNPLAIGPLAIGPLAIRGRSG